MKLEKAGKVILSDVEHMRWIKIRSAVPLFVWDTYVALRLRRFNIHFAIYRDSRLELEL